MKKITKICEVEPETGIVYLREAVTVAFFLPTPIHEIVDSLLAACNEYFKVIPQDVLRWESVGANSDVWKPINSTTLRRCRAQLNTAAAEKRSLTSFELADGEQAGDAANHGIIVIGKPATPQLPNELSLMQMYFPSEVVEVNHVEQFLDDICRIASLLPFVSGYVSPGLQWAEIGRRTAVTRSRKIMARYPGYDVQMNETGRKRLGLRVRGARWLTFIGPDIMKKLGDAESIGRKLIEPIQIETVGQGIMIRAGNTPEMGDSYRNVGTPLLRSVATVLQPVTVFEEGAILGRFSRDKEFVGKWEHRFLD